MSPGRPAQTTPEAWARAALDVIEESGVAAVAVEPVARRLGVSKGGFYHHFDDRRALLRAALELWERTYVVELSERFDAVEDPRERLRALLRVSALELEPSVITKLMAARDDEDVATVLERATTRRLALLARIFGQLGMPPARARNRALLAYSAYLGLAELRDEPAAGVRDERRVRGYLAELEELLAG